MCGSTIEIYIMWNTCVLLPLNHIYPDRSRVVGGNRDLQRRELFPAHAEGGKKKKLE